MKGKTPRIRKMDMKERVLSKFTTGRTKAIKKRKRTLLVEYKLLNKSNKFIDRRIGEKDRNMTIDDRAMARFVAQRMKAHSKKQLFNLDNNDEEILTHHGRTIAEIGKYDAVCSDSEEDENGSLNAKFVEKAHFGGGLFTKKSADDGNTHKSTIDQLIAESKRRKVERQVIKEETEILTEKLDKDLKELFPTLTKQDADVSENMTKTKFVSESYDMLVRELKFERTGKGTCHSKLDVGNTRSVTDKEKEREQRMKNRDEFNEDEDAVPEKHASADDLDDGLDLDVFSDCEDEENIDEDEDEDEYGGENHDINMSPTDETSDGKVAKTKLSAVPQNIEALLEKLDDKNMAEKIEAINNLVNSLKVHLGVSIKENAINFFKTLIQYIDVIFKEDEDRWSFMNGISPILFELTQMVGDDAGNFIRSSLMDKHEHFCEDTANVQEETLTLLKLIPILFPTSDYYHMVTTPAAVFISQMLSENSCRTLAYVAKGIFLSTVMLEFVHLSKRYCPESINFIRKVLYTAIPNLEDSYPPVHAKSKILILDHSHATETISADKLKLSLSSLTEDVRENDETRMALLFTTLRISKAYCQLYGDLSAVNAIWLPIRNLLSLLPVHVYPSCIRSEIEDVTSRMGTTSKHPLRYLLAQKKRPKALRLYEPNIRPVVDGKSFRTVSLANLEKEKLMRQYKKEKKGAYREIRKDQKLLTRVMISEKIKKDVERKEKVKQIFSWGQSQQSDFKRMERKNRFKK